MNAFYYVAWMAFVIVRGYLLAWLVIYLVNFIWSFGKKEE